MFENFALLLLSCLRFISPSLSPSPDLQPTARPMLPSLKRARPDPPDGPFSSRDVVKPQDRFDEQFNAASADVLLRTSDGTLFATRKDVLTAHSVVFEAMFAIPQPPVEGIPEEVPRADQKAPGTLPVVQMTEIRDELRVYLLWIHQDTHEKTFRALTRRWALLVYEYKQLASLLDCARKFETVSITLAVVQAIISNDDGTTPENMLALGIIFRHRTLVKLAIRTWIGGRTEGYPRFSVRSIWPGLVDRLSPQVFFHIAQAVDVTSSDQECMKLLAPMADPDTDSREASTWGWQKDNIDLFMKAYDCEFIQP